MRTKLAVCGSTLALIVTILAPTCWGQSFGIELHNTLMPASGGMAGTSIARPQDLQSAMGGNPATLTQYRGTHFSFGGGWAESTYNVEHDGGVLPNLGAFSAKSEAEGSALGNIGVSQEVTFMGSPATIGIGLMSTAGAGLSLRNVEASNGTSVSISILQMGSFAAVNVTDRLSVGASLMLGSSTLDAPFQGVSAAALAYQLRGSFGASYDLGYGNTLGFSYHTPQNFNYDDAIRLQIDELNFAAVQDINAGLPANYAVGIANHCLMDGRLLLAMDVVYKQWETADMFGDLYDNQWVLQLGAQYSLNNKLRLRMGYAYAENPIDTTLGDSAGGVFPPGPAERVQAALQYVQATVAVVNRHRITGGVGIKDVMPNVDLDLFAGGMFGASQELGEYTRTSLASSWIGGGFTWHFGSPQEMIEECCCE